MSFPKDLIIKDLGLTDYDNVLELQHDIVSKKVNGHKEDFLILVEHPHTYTIGRNRTTENLLVSKEYLRRKNIKLREISRGGDIIYHGPGQIVGYPIIDLKNYKKDLHWYLELLENIFVKILKEEFNISSANKIDDLTGVWVDNKKIAFIGIGVKKWITFHGFAFNVNPEIKFFDYIIPCGIDKKGVTTLNKLQPNKSFDKCRIKKLISDYFQKYLYSNANMKN